MTQIIKNITVELSNDTCDVEAKALHSILLQLPAEVYLELYKIMQNQITNEEAKDE